MKSFGVGCLHFSIKDNQLKKSITVKEYIDEITKTLEELSTISELDIYCSDDIVSELIELTDLNPKLQNGEACHPFLDFFKLSFNIYIPYSLQAKTINTNEEYLDTYTENFKVTYLYNWYGPVSFIECLHPRIKPEGSTSVRIVREYLLKEVSDIDTFLEVDFIGPSPFHANFNLSLNENINDDNFNLEYIKKEGYDELNFTGGLKYFDDEDSALDTLQQTLENELAFFYAIKVRQVKEIHDWKEIHDGLHLILDFETPKSKKTFIDKFVKRPKLFRDVFINIGLFKGQNIFNTNIHKTDYANIYTHSANQTYLKVLLDKEISESSSYPLNETIELLKYFDQKSSKTFELTVILVTTILGGVIGSLITLLFS